MFALCAIVQLELREGNTISYYIPNSIVGTKGLLATAIITGVRPGEEYPLSLSTPHILSHDHNIAKGPSRFNSMTIYKLIPGCHGLHSDAILEAAGSLSRSMNRTKRMLANCATLDGFAPMDVLMRTKWGTNGNLSLETEGSESLSLS